jgi:hypothetical protein
MQAGPFHKGLPCRSHRGLGVPPFSCPQAPPPRKAPPACNKFNQLLGGLSGGEDNDKGWDSKWGFCMPTEDPHLPPTRATRLAAPANTTHASATQGSTKKGCTGNTPAVAATAGLDMAALLSTLLTAQAEVQLAQTNTNHTNLIVFQTATA